MRRTILITLTSIVFILTACSSSAPAQTSAEAGKPVKVTGGEYRDVSVSELQSMMEEKDFVFVNVHIPFEGDLPNTDLSIPFDEISQNLGQLPAEKDAKIVLYCRSGRMSQIAAEELVRLGYTNVWNLDGGFIAWEEAGLQVEGR